MTWWIEVSTYFTYDLLDNVIQTTQDTASWTQVTTNFVYDANQQLIEKQLGTQAKTTYDYNEFGKLESEKILVDELDISKDIITSYSYDDNNNLISKTDPNGNITSYEYDLYD